MGLSHRALGRFGALFGECRSSRCFFVEAVKMQSYDERPNGGRNFSRFKRLRFIQIPNV